MSFNNPSPPGSNFPFEIPSPPTGNNDPFNIPSPPAGNNDPFGTYAGSGTLPPGLGGGGRSVVGTALLVLGILGCIIAIAIISFLCFCRRRKATSDEEAGAGAAAGARG